MGIQPEEVRAPANARQRDEHRLRGELAFVAAVTGAMGEGLCALDADGHFLLLNPAAEAMLGWAPGELIGRHMHEAVHYRRADGTPYPVEECPLHRGRALGIQVRIEDDVFVRRDGTLLRVAYVGTPLHGGGPGDAGSVVVFRDISERHLAETERTVILGAERAARADAEAAIARMKQTLETIDEAYVVMDPELRVLEINRRGAEMLGRSREELVGQRLIDVLPGAEQAASIHAVRRAFTLGHASRFEGPSAVRDAWIEMDLYPSDGNVIVFARDVTARREAERERYENEERLRIALDAGSMGTWDWNPATGRLAWSERLEEIYGLAPGSFPGTFEAFVAAVVPEDREALQRAIADAGRHDGHLHVKHRVQRPDGTVRWVEGLGRALRDSAGVVVRMVGVTLDVTEREAAAAAAQEMSRTLEERVQERTRALEAQTRALLESNEELDRFSYSISHDLRAPLRAMRGYADLILDDSARTDAMLEWPKGYARRIAEMADQMDRLVQDLLNYSRLSRTSLVAEPIQLATVVEEALTHLPIDRDGAEHVIDLQVDADLPAVLGHRATVFQVISNLLTNALKFVAPGARPSVCLRAEVDGRVVRLWVEDNGIGIEPRHHERIFRVFERLHPPERYPGTGVGLAIVRKGVQRMGGRCGFESTPGVGSRFWIELPIASDRG